MKKCKLCVCVEGVLPNVLGWLPIIFTVEERSTKQAQYICKKNRNIT